VAGVPGEELGSVYQGLTDWVKRWGRTPSWLYLPHLEEGKSGRAEEDLGGTAMADGSSATGGDAGGAASSGSVHAIRGRDHSPGPRNSVAEASGSAVGLEGGVATRRHAKRPEPGGLRVGHGAKARTSELEAWLQRAKAERAERGARRSVEVTQDSRPSAAERMEALRRRASARAEEAVLQRHRRNSGLDYAAPREGIEDNETNVPACASGASARGEVWSSCMRPTGTPTSIEDAKIQLNQKGRIRNGDPACAPYDGGSAAASHHSSGGGGARTTMPSAEVEDAAKRVAWHTVDAGQRLTSGQGAG
jgi:hypothetical protein